MMIRAVGATSLMATQASMPERLGMRTSIRITSGTVDAASSVAATPSPASPTTSMSSSTPRSIVSPRRNSSWSSTTATRMGSPPGLGAVTCSATDASWHGSHLGWSGLAIQTDGRPAEGSSAHLEADHAVVVAPAPVDHRGALRLLVDEEEEVVPDQLHLVERLV